MKDSVIKKKKRKRRNKRNAPSPLPPCFLDVSSKGKGNRNRVDARVQLLDLKRKGLPSSARLINEGDVLFIERNGKIADGRKRKAKCRTPTKPDNRPTQNLGRIMKEYPLVRIRPRGPLCGYVARILRQKTDESFRVLSIVQDLLKGTVLESDFFYHACSPYLRGCAGKLLVSRKPSLGASRLILTQLLRVRSNFPFERLETAIRQGKGTKSAVSIKPSIESANLVN
jgi:hypothetical protein